MPISPFTVIQIIQKEYHNRLSRRDEEDRLQSELQGDQHEFTLESGEEYQEVALSIENTAVRSDSTVLISLSLQNYECPTSVDDWEDDIVYLYTITFLQGKGSAEEMASPLLSGIEITGHNPRDIRISMYVHSTYQSAIWHAIERIAEAIHQYHSDHFQYVRGLYDEIQEDFIDDEDALNMGHGLELAQRSDHHNIFQATFYLNNYFNHKVDQDTDEDSKPISAEFDFDS